MVEFFLVVLPGLEDIVQQEVLEWFPEWKPKIEYGGVTVLAPLEQGLYMNSVLKTPTRVLMRVDSFVCRDFPKLFKKISSFSWKDWLPADTRLEVKASSTKSRLKIKKRIEETCLDGWKAYQKKNKKVLENKSSSKTTLYVRLNDNLCTLSLDTSGQLLHKRGMRTHIGEAPLRETIAAALLQWLGQVGDSQHQEVEVVDPMMGSGTFLLEALIRDSILGPKELNITKPENHSKITSLVGYEKDAKTVRAAQENLSKQNRSDCSLHIFEEDFFKAKVLPPSDKVRWVICNPPYGVRLKVKEPLMDYYAHLFHQVRQILDPSFACFLLPKEGVKGKLKLPLDWKVLKKLSFSNGGISVVAYIFSNPTRSKISLS